MRAVRVAVRVALAGACFVLFGLALFTGVAGADNCSSPGDCEETGGYNGAIAVVGGAAAVAAAAAAAIAKTPEGEETDLAIVQVSTDRVDIEIGKPADVTLTGWHVGADQQLKRVGMALWIEFPPAAGIKVEPASGTGEMTASVSVDEATLPDDTTEVDITAWGDWNGKRASETVTVHIGGELELKLTEEPDGLGDGGGGSPELQDLLDPDNGPVGPGGATPL